MCVMHYFSLQSKRLIELEKKSKTRWKYVTLVWIASVRPIFEPSLRWASGWFLPGVTKSGEILFFLLETKKRRFLLKFVIEKFQISKSKALTPFPPPDPTFATLVWVATHTLEATALEPHPLRSSTRPKATRTVTYVIDVLASNTIVNVCAWPLCRSCLFKATTCALTWSAPAMYRKGFFRTKAK